MRNKTLCAQSTPAIYPGSRSLSIHLLTATLRRTHSLRRLVGIIPILLLHLLHQLHISLLSHLLRDALIHDLLPRGLLRLALLHRQPLCARPENSPYLEVKRAGRLGLRDVLVGRDLVQSCAVRSARCARPRGGQTVERKQVVVAGFGGQFLGVNDGLLEGGHGCLVRGWS